MNLLNLMNSMNPIWVRELNGPDLPAAVGIVARGMRDNPLHIAALGNDANQRTNRLTGMFKVALPLVLSKGLVLGAFDDQTLVGIAGMIAPGHCQPTLMEKLTLTPRVVPAVGFEAAARVRSWLDQWAKYDLRQPHWHLGPVAVDAHLQGTGIGTRLMHEYCSRLDLAHATGYLETDKASNVKFYEKCGFETIASAPVLETPNWFMKRAAR
jgi:ribosomal protein S18 acetylase RimI-like enzyme